MTIEKDKIDLNAPAFGPGSQNLEEAKPTAEAVVEPVEVKKEEVSVESSEEESKVPYSRFKKFHDRAIDAEREAAEWRAKAESIKPEPVSTSNADLPEFWKELYGDSEASQKAWKIQSEQNALLKEEARREAVEAVRNERFEESKRTDQNVEKLDENFEDLSALVGRDLTDKEQSDVLDIVDEYTPKDEYGNYLGVILPFEKAWEIYGLKAQASKAPKAQARDQVASLSGAQSQGETIITEKDKNFNPLDWNAWRTRI